MPQPKRAVNGSEVDELIEGRQSVIREIVCIEVVFRSEGRTEGVAHDPQRGVGPNQTPLRRCTTSTRFMEVDNRDQRADTQLALDRAKLDDYAGSSPTSLAALRGDSRVRCVVRNQLHDSDRFGPRGQFVHACTLLDSADDAR
ncbi:hypothetical protein [Antrihabitans sp. YC2-6]|uniref:hypothetical protein n=1 Tax=Antrihabitans sp. YC2-6 TaxID=2799498 RepID=UPI0018F54688|nr:hypothetical protein [Antrihabitans sp. YC2-6]MBJ8348454.1 hypothetical protein [Antrihabitans sp. YC2-6]